MSNYYMLLQNDIIDFDKLLLDKYSLLGLDEVEVTKRSRDGGIDLTAIRKGVGDFSNIDITHYYIQQYPE